MNENTSDGAAAGTPRDAATDAQPVQRPLPEDQLAPLNAMIIEAQIVDALETVFDPEIPVNIYELGLIYGIDVKSDGVVDVTMTLTAPSCPAAQTLPREVEEKIRAINGVSAVNIDITFDPPWEMSRMTDAARLQLGLM